MYFAGIGFRIGTSKGKIQLDADRYIRIASRSDEENNKLIEALVEVMYLRSNDE